MILEQIKEEVHYKMLGFKFIDTLEEQGKLGPVPLFGVFGGSNHQAIINSTGIFNSLMIRPTKNPK